MYVIAPVFNFEKMTCAAYGSSLAWSLSGQQLSLAVRVGALVFVESCHVNTSFLSWPQHSGG